MLSHVRRLSQRNAIWKVQGKFQRQCLALGQRQWGCELLRPEGGREKLLESRESCGVRAAQQELWPSVEGHRPCRTQVTHAALCFQFSARGLHWPNPAGSQKQEPIESIHKGHPLGAQSGVARLASGSGGAGGDTQQRDFANEFCLHQDEFGGACP